MLNDDGMAACDFLGVLMTGEVPGSRDSTKPMKMIAEQGNNVWKDCEKCYFSTKLLKDTIY